MKTKKRPSEARSYDVEMIRDFIEHLLWEVRIGHFEATSADGAINPELLEQIQRYQKKRQTIALLAANEIPASGRDEVGALKRRMAEVRQRQVDHLEALHTLFEEALFCASHPRTYPVRDHDSVADALAAFDDDGPQGCP
jgi:hypothetical protein